jgi:ribosomal protein S27AE
MNDIQTKFCPQCGADDVTATEITPSHVQELHCPRCGITAVLLWEEHELAGHTASHDPNSDNESW